MKNNGKIHPNGENIHPLKRVKFGIDPTDSRLHLGHLVGLRAVAMLAKQKRDITVVLGTFTATLGDPSGKNITRPILTRSVVNQNAEAIKEQVIKLFRFPFTFVENSIFANRISMADFISDISTKFSVTELMARDNFQGRGVSLQELLVPLAQAWDSICLDTEIEVGGEDQLINFTLTRQLQTAFGKRPQTCILTPIINGTDGRKMSKSLNNGIFLDDHPEIIKDKIMRTADAVTDTWIPLLTEGIFIADPRERKTKLVDSIISQVTEGIKI